MSPMGLGVCRYLPSIALLSVFLFSSYHIHFENFTPWKGGSFGMFSTIDSFESRFLKFYLIDEEEKECPIPSPERFYRLVRSIRSNPTSEKLSKLAGQVLESSPQSLGCDPDRCSCREVSAVRIEVWRYTIDREGNQLKAVKWMEKTEPERAP